jgi:hypothetical protein
VSQKKGEVAGHSIGLKAFALATKQIAVAVSNEWRRQCNLTV